MKGGASSLDGVLTTKYLDTVDDQKSEWIKLWQKIWDGEVTASRCPTTGSTAWLRPTPSCRRCRPPARTSPGRASSTPSRRTAPFEGPLFAPFAYSQDSHMGTTGMRVASLKGATVRPRGQV